MRSCGSLIDESVDVAGDVGDKGKDRSTVSVRVETAVNDGVLRARGTGVDTSTFHTMPMEPVSGISIDLKPSVSRCRFFASLVVILGGEDGTKSQAAEDQLGEMHFGLAGQYPRSSAHRL